MVALCYQDGAEAGGRISSMAAEMAFLEACRICCFYKTESCANALQDIVVPHIHQAFNWDCGLACVQMVLGAFQADCPDLGLLRRMCATQSVWTVDLAHLLRKFCLDVTFTTLTLGANPQYSTESFYMEHLQEDAERVNQLFQGACAAGIVLERRSVPLAELQALMLCGAYLIIGLIDKRALGANGIWASELNDKLQTDMANDSGYAGHYVVISSYDAEEDCFSVCDPALATGHVKIASSMLEAARSAFGTDEDLLIIPRPSQRKLAQRLFLADKPSSYQQNKQLHAAFVAERFCQIETAQSATLC